jgi:hypothetical protein
MTKKKPTQSNQEAAQEYGYVQALFEANPELKALFAKAVKGTWSAAKFQAEIVDTKWFKTHGQQERDYLVLQYGDPATARQKIGQATIQARQLAESMGWQETAENQKKIQAVAYNMVAKGWTSEQAQYYLGQYITFKGGDTGGTAGQALDDLHAYSYNMGIKNSDKWYQEQARNVARGIATADDAKASIRKQAETMFPEWQKQLQAGQTVADLASPYMQSMSQILELPAGSINLFNPSIKKALQYKDPKSGANSVRPIWQFQNDLRNDPRWNSTKNAQDSAMQVAHQVLTDFGVSN